MLVSYIIKYVYIFYKKLKDNITYLQLTRTRRGLWGWSSFPGGAGFNSDNSQEMKNQVIKEYVPLFEAHSPEKSTIDQISYLFIYY